MSRTVTIALFVVVLGLLGAGLFILSGVHQSRSMVSPSTQMAVTPTVEEAQNTVPTDIPVNQIALSVVSPVDGAVVTSPTITVSGKTVANADVVINDIVLKADASGNFTTPITIDEGDNPIVVMSNDDSGNYSEKDLTVTYSPAQ